MFDLFTRSTESKITDDAYNPKDLKQCQTNLYSCLSRRVSRAESCLKTLKAKPKSKNPFMESDKFNFDTAKYSVHMYEALTSTACKIAQADDESGQYDVLQGLANEISHLVDANHYAAHWPNTTTSSGNCPLNDDCFMIHSALYGLPERDTSCQGILERLGAKVPENATKYNTGSSRAALQVAYGDMECQTKASDKAIFFNRLKLDEMTQNYLKAVSYGVPSSGGSR